MGLKQDVVIVNEFSVPLSGGTGSRGGTPGAYVSRYMAREGATESLAPIRRLRTDDFILRYMARDSAVERMPSRREAKYEMRQAQGDGGVAFGYGSVSLSDEQLGAASADIQRLFEDRHTVMKTVLSFGETYLKRHGILDPDFRCEKAGDYRGHLDQMKLRLAIMHGLERMASGTGGYDDLRYVGVVQVDTEHVHCHLAMVDAGPGRRAKDGTQKGKLLDRHKARLRRGIDAWLDEKQAVAHLSSAVGYERRNVTTYIKRWAHDRIRSEALPQFILACLPADRGLWRAGSNAASMRKADALVTELVAEQLARPGSPMPAAMERIRDYADNRRANEDLSTEQWQALIDRGRSQIVERAVNGVYQLLRAMPAEELTVRTPMLELMGMDYERMAVAAADEQVHGEGAGDLIHFGFRLRSYSSRLAHHRRQAEHNRRLALRWERSEAADVAAADSRPLYDHYRFEQRWHEQVIAKYQHFLPFLADSSAWQEEQQAISDYGARILSLISLRADASLARMKDAEEAERIGRDVYDQPGGRHLTQGRAGRAVLDGRIATMKRVYDERVAELRSRLASSGLVLELGVDETRAEAVTDEAVIVEGIGHDFAEVKALDLHHLGYDFVSDVEVGQRAGRAFLAAARTRRQLVLAAMDYLEGSGQSATIVELPVDDVAAMTRTARTLSAGRVEMGRFVLPSRIAELRTEQERSETARRSKASSLDVELAARVTARVDQAALEASIEPSDANQIVSATPSS
ncbi:relaxase MobL [Nocardiopsis alborubida]|uniref:Uncharacterized protein n=1 Tax=Nocardiopsis alborubida TaxID=146802 RepID=A0A7X6M9B8_9ACTN|nr:relaxase MobL [Nocardiopsis alborubida]NKY96527.1 hypothetical protein [Nocardiopsis alborubida]